MGKPGAGKGSQGRRPKGDAAKHKGKGSGGLPHPRSEPSGLGGTVQMPRSHVVTSLPGPGPNFISRVSHNVLAVIADMIRNAVAGNPQPVRKRLSFAHQDQQDMQDPMVQLPGDFQKQGASHQQT